MTISGDRTQIVSVDVNVEQLGIESFPTLVVLLCCVEDWQSINDLWKRLDSPFAKSRVLELKLEKQQVVDLVIDRVKRLNWYVVSVEHVRPDLRTKTIHLPFDHCERIEDATCRRQRVSIVVD